MNKICCVGDADVCQKTSSCSMVLRSACSHSRHSLESSSTTSKKSRSGTPRKSKRNSILTFQNSYETSDIGSVLESSLKQLALKSAKSTYSILKEYLYNDYEVSSENVNQRITAANALSVSSEKEFHLSQLSASSNFSFNNSINYNGYSSDYLGVAESDINSSELLNPTSNMRSTHFTRSSISSMRSLSGSEGEDDISVEKIIKTRRSMADTNSNYGLSRHAIHSEGSLNSHHISNNHTSYNDRHPADINSHGSKYTGSAEGDSRLNATGDSTQMDRSTVQHSLIDRFRWFLWRCNYLKIIRNINFDVWFLSRLHNYGKHRAIFFFLLPLILYILWDILHHNSFSYEALSQTTNSVFSTVFLFFSSLFSSLHGLFTLKEELVSVQDADESKCFSGSSEIFSMFSSLSGVSLFSGWFTKGSESGISDNDAKYEYDSSEEEIGLESLSKGKIRLRAPSKEEIRLLAMEALKDEINMLKDLHKSGNQGAQYDKLEQEMKLENELMNLRLEFQSLSGTIEKLEKNILKQEVKSQTTDRIIALASDYKSDIDHLNLKLKTIEAKLGVLEGLKSSCGNQWSERDLLALVEKHLGVVFRNIIDGDSDPNARYYFFNQWLNSKFFSRDKLMQEINVALRKHSAYQEAGMSHDIVVKVVESTVLKHVESIKKNLTDSGNGGFFSFGQNIFSEDKIKKIVKEAIMLYDADKTGQVDYALESGGGSVVGTRCTETYVEKYGKFSIFGVPLWTNSNSPRTAIQPDMQPGRCWGFKGSNGFLVLELSASIYPTGFTLEHIPVSLSPSGSIDSAPKNFSVWGLQSDKDNKGILLGEYWYDINGDPLQYFPVQKLSSKPYNYVELQVYSNHGNMEYTCLYRFRAHGRRA